MSGTTDVRRRSDQLPGGLSVRYRWAGTGGAAEVFSLSEAGGALQDLGDLASPDPDSLCRAEVRVEALTGAWTVRLASLIYDEPAGLFWDVPGLLVVRYGFRVYGLEARTGELRWSRASGTPITALLGSARLNHVLVQSELETLALDAAGDVVWRIAHSDVVVEAVLDGGTLRLRSYDGELVSYDATTGRAAG